MPGLATKLGVFPHISHLVTVIVAIPIFGERRPTGINMHLRSILYFGGVLRFVSTRNEVVRMIILARAFS